MSKVDFSSKTVIELRKLAKTYGVTLGAGVSKSDIIAKLVYALGEDFEEDTPEKEADETPTAAPAAETFVLPQLTAPSPEQRSSTAAPSAPAQTQYRPAWRNPSQTPAPRYNSRPSYQAPTYQQRPAWQAPQQRPAGDVPPRMGTVRPASFTPRFGPEASTPAQSSQQEEFRPYRAEQPRSTAYGPRPSYGENRSFDAPRQENPQEPQPAYGAYAQRTQQPSYPQQSSFTPAPSAGMPQQSGLGSSAAPVQPRRESGYFNQELGTANPAISELLAAGDCQDGAGVLEMHPDGYGFLRSDTLLPSSKDIYISMAQIRRFGLRTGDRVTGKTRPQRDGDRYTAMLYITEVNGQSPDSAAARPLFEELTPVYPTRRLSLESSDGKSLTGARLVDLLAPIGYGQRGLLLCQPDAGKTELIRDLANAISANQPNVTVMVLLIDETPEDVTLFREQVSCPVLASTFDQMPENHLRLADLAIERAQRLVELKQDVVLIVDSLTRLAKTYTTAAAQQGRAMPGMINPASLFRAKKLFGAARCMKEGGSLTIIGAMNVATGNKVDDTVVEEFKGTANMELMLDSSIARAGVFPAVNVQYTGTKHVENLLTPQRLEGLRLIRSTFSSANPTAAVQQLLSMMEKTSTNDELAVKIKDWLDLMKNGRNI